MKKYLTFDFIGTIVLGIGLVVISIALVCNGFNEMQMDGYPEWLATACKVVGFAGTAVFPTVWVTAIREQLNEEGE